VSYTKLHVHTLSLMQLTAFVAVTYSVV